MNNPRYKLIDIGVCEATKTEHFFDSFEDAVQWRDENFETEHDYLICDCDNSAVIDSKLTTRSENVKIENQYGVRELNVLSREKKDWYFDDIEEARWWRDNNSKDDCKYVIRDCFSEVLYDILQ